MSTHGLILLLFVNNLGRECIGVALFDVFDGLQALDLVQSVICTLHALAPAAQVTRSKTLAVKLQTSRFLARTDALAAVTAIAVLMLRCFRMQRWCQRNRPALWPAAKTLTYSHYKSAGVFARTMTLTILSVKQR